MIFPNSFCSMRNSFLPFKCSEAEILDVIGRKVLRVFLLAIHSHLYRFDPPPPLPPQGKSGLKLVCNVNIVYRNLKSENSQDYAQKPQRNCTFMNSTSVQYLVDYEFHGKKVQHRDGERVDS